MAQAQASVVAAVRAGEKRLRVEVLPPGLNKMIEGSHAYSEPLLGYVGLSLAAALRGLSVQTIFPSAGTAAGAASSYKRAMGSEGPCPSPCLSPPYAAASQLAHAFSTGTRLA